MDLATTKSKHVVSASLVERRCPSSILSELSANLARDLVAQAAQRDLTSIHILIDRRKNESVNSMLGLSPAEKGPMSV
jgi:hypothetical protein